MLMFPCRNLFKLAKFLLLISGVYTPLMWCIKNSGILCINCFEKLCLSRDFKISLTLLTLTVLLCMSRLVIYAVIVLNACINEMVFEIFLQFPNHRYNTFLVKKGNYCK